MLNHSSDRYVLVKSFRGGGLGDALRTVILSLLYAKRWNRRVVIDWRDGSFAAEGEDSFNMLFNPLDLDPLNRLVDLGDQLTVIPSVWQGNLDCSMQSLWIKHGMTGWNRDQARKIFSFDQNSDHSQDVCVMWDFDSLSRFSLNEIQKCINTCLLPNSLVAAQKAEFVRNYFSSSMLGIHLRAARELEVQKNIVSRNVIKESVDSLMQSGGFDGIFLATDHGPTLEWFLSIYPNTIVRSKPFSPHGAPLHLTDFGQSRFEQTRDALLDMLLLSSCQALLIPTNSSFSRCASYFSGLDQKYIHHLKHRTSLSARLLRSFSQKFKYLLP